ncbi:MAG: 16S rRNA (guanine(527)-N(7))-methyltransferase RsmG [Candidatus Methylomirabilales bacterium]
MEADLGVRLARESGRLGLSLPPSQIGDLLRYMDLLWRWNARMNLVGFRDRTVLLTEGVIDALTLLSAFTPHPGQRLLDVGSGAGLPGIPLKVAAPEIDATLLEPIRKRVSFLLTVVRELGLTRIRVVRGRSEEISSLEEHRRAYEIVTARAVAGVEEAARTAAPFVAPHGLLILPRGQEAAREAEGLRGGSAGGLVVDRLLPSPLGRGDRHLLLLRAP